MPLSAGQCLNERYRIERQIGQGGFGAVYRAYDVALRQPCAIKENLNTGAEAQRQFEREALILARLHHSNLPRVIDHFTRPGQGEYLVMDFVEGYNLANLLEVQAQPLSQEAALARIDQVCQALSYLHQQSPPIIHRDIKPQNIIITPEGQAMLVDFGLSKLYDEQLRTSTGARGLTFGYAPPEQYGEGRTNVRTDIYALGATLYTMLTGQRPPDAIQRLVNDEPLIPPSQLIGQVSPHVEEAILKAMALTPSERFESVEAFRRALALPPTRPVIPVKAQGERPGLVVPYWLVVALGRSLRSLIVLGLIVAVFGLGYWAIWSGFNGVLSPIPTPEFPFEVAGVEKRSEQSATMFQGIIRDAAGNPLNNHFVQATCGNYSIISFPSGPVPWGNEKGGGNSTLAWAPGYYNINLAASQPCLWALTLVETEDRQTVKARLSPTITVEVGPDESPIIVNWQRVN